MSRIEFYTTIMKTLKANLAIQRVNEIKQSSRHNMVQQAHFRIGVALCRACRPWIFFINGVLFFLKINDSGMEKEER